MNMTHFFNRYFGVELRTSTGIGDSTETLSVDNNGTMINVDKVTARLDYSTTLSLVSRVFINDHNILRLTVGRNESKLVESRTSHTSSNIHSEANTISYFSGGTIGGSYSYKFNRGLSIDVGMENTASLGTTSLTSFYLGVSKTIN